MMRIKLLGIAGLMALALTGCQNTSDREAALEDQVAQLEQQVTSLEKEKQKLNEEQTSSQNTVSENEAAVDASSENAEKDDLDSLSKAVEDVVKKVNSASPSGTKDKDQQNFFEAKSTLQDVENRLERYEDSVESQFRQGNLSHDQARDTEIKIERLEDQLDEAEDTLEFRFGYDD